jgi:hypothetical protein
MVPTNASAIVAFFLLTAPGVIFELMRERRRPGLSDSVLREASRIILASTVFTCSAFLVLGLLRILWPSSMPDPGRWLSQGRVYLQTSYEVVFRALFLEIVLAIGFAWVASWLLNRSGRASIRHVSAWYRVFRLRAPRESRPFVRVRLRTGRIYTGFVSDYSEELALLNRELVLEPPISFVNGESAPSQIDTGWQRMVVTGEAIETMWVSYITDPKGRDSAGAN